MNDTAEAKLEKPWQFKKGQSGNPGGKPKSGDSSGKGVPCLLADMRFVYGHAPCKDRSQGHKECREWLKSDRKSFLCKMSDLEKALVIAEGKAGGKDEPSVPMERDEGAERVHEAIDRLMKEWTGKGEDKEREEYERLKRKFEKGE